MEWIKATRNHNVGDPPFKARWNKEPHQPTQHWLKLWRADYQRYDSDWLSDLLWKADHQRYDSEGLPRGKSAQRKREDTTNISHPVCIYSQWLLFIPSRAFEKKTRKRYIIQKLIEHWVITLTAVVCHANHNRIPLVCLRFSHRFIHQTRES